MEFSPQALLYYPRKAKNGEGDFLKISRDPLRGPRTETAASPSS